MVTMTVITAVITGGASRAGGDGADNRSETVR